MNQATLISSVCVFCGSTPGNDPAYLAAADLLGTALGAQGITLVFGGSDVGLMGQVSTSHMKAGGRVIGVYPTDTFSHDVAHPDLDVLHEVGSMHERKALMYELSDAVVALPGGYGTLEELTEALTWNQLGIHVIPTVLLNVNGFWDGFVDFLDHAVVAGFLKQSNRDLVHVTDRVDDVVALLNRADRS